MSEAYEERAQENLRTGRWPVNAADSVPGPIPIHHYDTGRDIPPNLPLQRADDPTQAQLAASIGCDPTEILRSVKHHTKKHHDGRDIWTSFVDQDDEENVAVYETVWPQ